MTIKLYTAPAAEPVIAAEVKAQLGITDTGSDTVINRRITEARQWVEEYTRRAIISQTWDLYLDAFADLIRVPLGNLQSVTHVKYTDENGTLQTLSSAKYQVDTYSQPGRIMPAYGESWPSTRADTFNTVNVRFVCGYGADGNSVPGPMREAMLLLVGHWMGFQPGIEGGVSITRPPYAVLDLLAPYRLHEFG